MIPVSHARLELDPIEIDPRPCGFCGRKIDGHVMVDEDGEGPIFYCPDDLEIQIHLAAADLVKQWELADPRDRWKHTGETPPPASVRNSDIAAKPNAPRPYRVPQSTIDAFFYVAGLGDAENLRRWLQQHPRDAETLCKLWEGKNVKA
jgi:hypothetical protein